MEVINKNFALPKETSEALDRAVESEKQGELLASLIERWLEEQRRAALREAYVAGLKDMEDVSIRLEQDFNPLEEEWHRDVSE